MFLNSNHSHGGLKRIKRLISYLLCLLLFLQQTGISQAAESADLSGFFQELYRQVIPDKYMPLRLRFLSYDTKQNNFQLLVDKGDEKSASVENGTQELLKFFFTGISIPDSSFWVNLRPDSEDQIIDDYLSQTDIGKILLQADLQLKKDAASFTSPQTPQGKEFWNKLYKKAQDIFGYTPANVPFVCRPWIVPGEVIVRETENNAYIYKAQLKVLLEEDYLNADSRESKFANIRESDIRVDSRLKELNEYAAQLLRELIIPKLTKEVNLAKRYAPLRQVYYSLILSQWFKKKFYGKNGLYCRLIDKCNLDGITSKEYWSTTEYFQAYKQSIEKGEYNIQENVGNFFNSYIRSYVTGGILLKIFDSPTQTPRFITANPNTSLTPKGLGAVGVTIDSNTRPFDVNLKVEKSKEAPPQPAESGPTKVQPQGASFESLIEKVRAVLGDGVIPNQIRLVAERLQGEGITNPTDQQIRKEFKDVIGRGILGQRGFLGDGSGKTWRNIADKIKGFVGMLRNRRKNSAREADIAEGQDDAGAGGESHSLPEVTFGRALEVDERILKQWVRDGEISQIVSQFTRIGLTPEGAEEFIQAILRDLSSAKRQELIGRLQAQENLPEAAQRLLERLKAGQTIDDAGQTTDDLGLCLTPDSLIHLADGTKKPLIELEEGDLVLSLNQETQQLEPHRVNALLDMGVKSVYKITTKSGRQLKTTLNHPYLTKKGWKKLKDIKVGEEIAVANEDLCSTVGVFSGINTVDYNICLVNIETDTILSDSESMSCRREIDQGFSKGQSTPRGDIQINLFNNAFLELYGEFLKFAFTGGSKFKSFNHCFAQDNPSSCLIFSKGTNPNLLASSIPLLSLNTNLGLIGRCSSIASISQPTGLWNTYSLEGTFSSNLLSKAQSKSQSECVSNTKYLGEPFLSTTTAALKSLEDISDLTSLGIEANLSNDSNLTGVFADSLINPLDFIFISPSHAKYNTLRYVSQGNLGRLKLFSSDKFFPRHFNVFKNFIKDTFAKVFAFMKRNHSSTAITMSKEDMASFLTNTLETKTLKNSNNLGGLKRSKLSHQTSTSCRPTNSKAVGCSTSRQSWIASLILSSKVGKVLAWVWQPFKAGTVAIKTLSSSFSMRTKNWFLRIFSSPLFANECDIASYSVLKDNTINCARQGNLGVKFESIVSIEYLGVQQVYDIEVEGTHNFIANGIFAHNTYLDKSDPTQSQPQGASLEDAVKETINARNPDANERHIALVIERFKTHGITNPTQEQILKEYEGVRRQGGFADFGDVKAGWRNFLKRAKRILNKLGFIYREKGETRQKAIIDDIQGDSIGPSSIAESKEAPEKVDEINIVKREQGLIDTHQTVAVGGLERWTPKRILIDIAQNHCDETRLKKAELWSKGEKKAALALKAEVYFILHNGKMLSASRAKLKGRTHVDVKAIMLADNGDGYDIQMLKYRLSHGKTTDEISPKILKAFAEMGIDVPGGQFGEGAKMLAASILYKQLEQEAAGIPPEQRVCLVYKSQDWEARLVANPVEIQNKNQIKTHSVAFQPVYHEKPIKGSRTIIENPTKEIFESAKEIDYLVLDFSPPQKILAQTEEGIAFETLEGEEPSIYVDGYRIMSVREFHGARNLSFSYNLQSRRYKVAVNRDRDRIESDVGMIIGDILFRGLSKETIGFILRESANNPINYKINKEGYGSSGGTLLFEYEALGRIYYHQIVSEDEERKKIWRDAFYECFGEDSILASSYPYANDSTLQARDAGDKLVALEYYLFKLLEKCGVATDHKYTRRILSEYKTGLSLDYEKERWGVLRIVLDFLQNHADAAREYSDSAGRATQAHIEFQVIGQKDWLPWTEISQYKNKQIEAVRFSDDSAAGYFHLFLHQFGSRKRESASEQVGKFGEGLKIASSASLRLGLEVELRSQNWQAKAFSYSERANNKVYNNLGYRVLEDDDRVGSETIVRCPDHGGQEAIEARQNFNELLDVVRNLKSLVLRHKEVDLDTQNPEPLVSTETGDIVSSDQGDIYVKDFFITSEERERTLFSYNFRQIKINRDRDIVSNNELNTAIGKILSRVTSPELIRKILEQAAKNPHVQYHEFQNLCQFPEFEENKTIWAQVFKELFGDDAVLMSSDTSATQEAKFVGYDVININSEVVHMLQSAGILLDSEVISAEYKYLNKDMLTENEKRVLDAATFLDKNKIVFLDKKDTEYRIFEVAINSVHRRPMPNILGHADILGRKIIAFKRSTLSNPIEFLDNYLHEKAHQLTGAPDGSREHFNMAVNAAIRLIQNLKDNVGQVNQVLRWAFPDFDFNNVDLEIDKQSQKIRIADKSASDLGTQEESPDMSEDELPHPERNVHLERQIRNARIDRVTKDGKESPEEYKKTEFSSLWERITYTINRIIYKIMASRAPMLHEDVLKRLNQIRAPNGILAEVAASKEFNISDLAQTLGRTEEEVCQELIRIAQETDLLIVKGRLTLHHKGPFGHARRNQSDRGTAIWLGEKLFTQSNITNQDIALLLLEEATHILAPGVTHDVIHHNQALQDKLKSTANQLGETPGTKFCEADMAGGQDEIGAETAANEIASQANRMVSGVSIPSRFPRDMTFSLELEFNIRAQLGLRSDQTFTPQQRLDIIERIGRILPQGWQLQGQANFNEYKTKIHLNSEEDWRELQRVLKELREQLPGGLYSAHMHISRQSLVRGNNLEVDSLRLARLVKVYEALWRALSGNRWRSPTSGWTVRVLDDEATTNGQSIREHNRIINLSNRYPTIEIKIITGLLDENGHLNHNSLQRDLYWAFALLSLVEKSYDPLPLAILGMPVLAGSKPNTKVTKKFLDIVYADDSEGRRVAETLFDSLANEAAGLPQDQQEEKQQRMISIYNAYGLGLVYKLHKEYGGYDEKIVEHLLEPETLRQLASDLVHAGLTNEVALGFFPAEMHLALLEALRRARGEIPAEEESRVEEAVEEEAVPPTEVPTEGGITVEPHRVDEEQTRYANMGLDILYRAMQRFANNQPGLIEFLSQPHILHRLAEDILRVEDERVRSDERVRAQDLTAEEEGALEEAIRRDFEQEILNYFPEEIRPKVQEALDNQRYFGDVFNPVATEDAYDPERVSPEARSEITEAIQEGDTERLRDILIQNGFEIDPQTNRVNFTPPKLWERFREWITKNQRKLKILLIASILPRVIVQWLSKIPFGRFKNWINKNQRKFKILLIAIITTVIVLWPSKLYDDTKDVPPPPSQPRIEQVQPAPSPDEKPYISNDESYYKDSYNGKGNRAPYEHSEFYSTAIEDLFRVYNYLNPQVNKDFLNILIGHKNAEGRPLNIRDIDYFWRHFKHIEGKTKDATGKITLSKHEKRAVEAAIGAWQLHRGDSNPTFDFSRADLEELSGGSPIQDSQSSQQVGASAQTTPQSSQPEMAEEVQEDIDAFPISTEPSARTDMSANAAATDHKESSSKREKDTPSHSGLPPLAALTALGVNSTRKKDSGGKIIHLFFAGRVTQEKGAEIFIDVLSSLQKEYKEKGIKIKGHILGEVAYGYKSRLESMAREIGIEDLDFFGAYNAESFINELNKYPRRDSIFVDTLGLVTREVMSMGFPIVSWDITARGGMQNSSRGAYAAAVSDLIEHPEKRDELIVNSRKVAENSFNHRLWLSKVFEAVEKVATKARGKDFKIKDKFRAYFTFSGFGREKNGEDEYYNKFFRYLAKIKGEVQSEVEGINMQWRYQLGRQLPDDMVVDGVFERDKLRQVNTYQGQNTKGITPTDAVVSDQFIPALNDLIYCINAVELDERSFFKVTDNSHAIAERAVSAMVKLQDYFFAGYDVKETMQHQAVREIMARTFSDAADAVVYDRNGENGIHFLKLLTLMYMLLEKMPEDKDVSFTLGVFAPIINIIHKQKGGPAVIYIEHTDFGLNERFIMNNIERAGYSEAVQKFMKQYLAFLKMIMVHYTDGYINPWNDNTINSLYGDFFRGERFYITHGVDTDLYVYKETEEEAQLAKQDDAGAGGEKAEGNQDIGESGDQGDEGVKGVDEQKTETSLSSKIETARMHTETFIKDLDVSGVKFGGIRELEDHPQARAWTAFNIIYFTPIWLAKMPADEIERVAGHEVQHEKTMQFWSKDGIDFRGLYDNAKFQDLQQRIGEFYDKAVEEKGKIFAKPKAVYQDPFEVLSLLRGYEVYLKQKERGISPVTQPYEFIEAFKPEDLEFLNKDFLYEITKDFKPKNVIVDISSTKKDDEAKSSSQSQEPPEPHFGHSGNKVDEKVLEAWKKLLEIGEMEKLGVDISAGNLEAVKEHIKEAIRLLREVGFDELDSSGFPIADTVNQAEVAIWVLEQLEAKGLLSQIDGGDAFLKALKEHQKNPDGFKLKQAVGYEVTESVKVASNEVEDVNNVKLPGGIDASTSLSINSQQGELGGIDFRKIDFTPQSEDLETSETGGNRADDLESARTLVEMAVEYRHIPSTSRIKDWIGFAVKSNQFQEERGKILIAIAGILRLEEEECTPTDNSLCEILILLEQEKPSQELYSCLSKI